MPAELEQTGDRPRLSTWQQLRTWMGVGLQSFGGGAATLALIRRAFVERGGHVTDAEFADAWAMCQLAPGVNLFGLTILIGKRLGGVRGIAVALLGLLFPSVTVTIALTAGLASLHSLPFFAGAVRGLVAGAIGLGIATAAHIALPLLHASRAEGRGSLALAVIVLLTGGVGFAAFHPPIPALVAAAALVGALGRWRAP